MLTVKHFRHQTKKTVICWRSLCLRKRGGEGLGCNVQFCLTVLNVTKVDGRKQPPAIPAIDSLSCVCILQSTLTTL